MPNADVSSKVRNNFADVTKQGIKQGWVLFHLFAWWKKNVIQRSMHGMTKNWSLIRIFWPGLLMAKKSQKQASGQKTCLQHKKKLSFLILIFSCISTLKYTITLLTTDHLTFSPYDWPWLNGRIFTQAYVTMLGCILWKLGQKFCFMKTRHMAFNN